MAALSVWTGPFLSEAVDQPGHSCGIGIATSDKILRRHPVLLSCFGRIYSCEAFVSNPGFLLPIREFSVILDPKHALIYLPS